MKKQPRPFPQAGDGIVTKLSKKRGIVLARITRGAFALHDNNPLTSPDDLVAVEVRITPPFKKSYLGEVGVNHFRQETFLEHLTRPTGFGKMPWVAFAALQAVFTLGFLVGGDAWWIVAIAFAVVNGVLTYGTWMNYTRKWN